MKKLNFLLSALTGVGITVGILGCSVDGINEPLQSQSQAIPKRMVATYAPAAGSLPLPNDLLFGGTADLTLNIPVADESDYSDPKLALSSLDGWSAVAPFAISFSSVDPSLSIDPASVVGGSSVHLYKVNVARGEVIPGSGIPKPTGPVTSVERELTAGLEYVVQATGATSIAIIPTVPFEQQASYMVVLTNGLMDSDGLPVLHDAQYAIAQHPAPIDPASAVAGLEPVRQLVNAMENAAAAFTGGPARSSIIMSYQFTVQSVGSVMRSAKKLYIDGPIAQGLGAGQLPPMNFSSLGIDTGPITGIGAADLYKGNLTLSYLLSAPTAANPIAPLNTFWRALAELPIGPGGSLVPNPFGENLTYANSFPRANGAETVPLLITMPKAAICPMPATGYPVTIFQHGITGNRTQVLGIADSLANAPSCRAAVAMDLPLHGIDANNALHQALQAATNGLVGIFEGYTPGALRERTFGMDYTDNATGAPGPDGMPDSSGKYWINLSNLLVARDNNRQGILDLLYLEQAISYMDVNGDGMPDFDASDIGYIGHSLGGMVGTGVVAYSATNEFLGPVVPSLKSAALVNPGGGTVAMILASPTFGPAIRAGLSAAFGAAEGTPEFDASLAGFSFAAQTVLDSSDPVNLAALAVTNNVPTLLMQNMGDNVVPNAVATAPLSGTEPLGRSLALTTLTAVDPGMVAGSRVFSRLNIGGHASILLPDAATAEMQSQVVSFLASGGTAVLVTDPSLLY
ncbi:MAG: hypothetical protein Q9M92_03255 [Enterobacterales bacterium]|nr:hypothetical protein [Enterobacterales bacterium]